jgi:MOSC domain-containing protein YiiM
MREAALPEPRSPRPISTFRACLATILELPPEQVPQPEKAADPAGGWAISRWLGGFGLGIVRVAEPASFSWPGPWIARVQPPATEPRYVVMFGVPSGVVWDPGDGGAIRNDWITDALIVAAADVALALPTRPAAPAGAGTLETISIAPVAGAPSQQLQAVQALAGRGLAEDRHINGTGTFPSGLPGSALTLIEAEVCDSFDPPLRPDEHRRNLVTRGIDLNALVGRDFTIGEVRCLGMRLCEPCTVVQGYASRPLLRALVHRGGLRADILGDGEIRVGDPVKATPAGTSSRDAVGRSPARRP